MIKLIGDYVLDVSFQKFVVKKGWNGFAESADLTEVLQAATDDIIRETIVGNVDFSKEETEAYTKTVKDLIDKYNHCYELFKGIATGGKENG